MLYANPKTRILLRRELLPGVIKFASGEKKNLLTRSSRAPDGIIIKKLPPPAAAGSPPVRGLISPRVLLYPLFSLLHPLPGAQLITDLMPTRAQIAKKFRLEEARDGVTMSGISEWKRFFRSSPLFFLYFVLFYSKNRFTNSVVGVFFSPSARYLTTFRSRYLKFPVGLRASVCNTNGTCILKKGREKREDDLQFKVALALRTSSEEPSQESFLVSCSCIARENLARRNLSGLTSRSSSRYY